MNDLSSFFSGLAGSAVNAFSAQVANNLVPSQGSPPVVVQGPALSATTVPAGTNVNWTLYGIIAIIILVVVFIFMRMR